MIGTLARDPLVLFSIFRPHPWVSAHADSPVDSIGVVDRSPEAMALRSALSVYGSAHSQYRVTMETIKGVMIQ